MKKKIFPDFSFEEKYWSQNYAFVVGVDEVGRGSLAGPLVAAAVVFDSSTINNIKSFGIDDSKRLTSKKRKDLSEKIKEVAISWVIAESSVDCINEMGIVGANYLAMENAVEKLKKKISDSYFILVDGYQIKNREGKNLQNQLSLVKGDQRSISIAAASIIAKVYRDDLMTKLAKEYSMYDWQKNKGYGTKFHLDAIKKFGATIHHRKDFID